MKPAVFYKRVAQYILSQHAHELPDLSGTVVLLPNHHVAQPLAKALEELSWQHDLLMPQMVTLSDWAQSIPLPSVVIPDTTRAAALYQALRDRHWFKDANLWAISNELIGLLDELTQHHVKLPQDEQDFLAQLEAAYQAKSNGSMQFEARVVHELWYAMGTQSELDASRAYQARLAVLSQQATSSLVVLLASDLDGQEAGFLAAYAKSAPVKVFDLREMMAQEKDFAVMGALPSLWARGKGLSLRSQATRLRVQFPDAALGQRLRLYSANSLEQEARAAEMQVRSWLAEGKRNIAIVAQDRLVARRVRAMLERYGVQVHDESGWKLSTMSVSTVLMRWLDALQSDFAYQDLFDLLKSPYIFSGQDALQSKRAVFKLEKLVRKHGVTSRLDAYIDLAQGETEVQDLLARLQQAAGIMHKSSDTLSGWLKALEESLVIIGITDALAGDMAGVQLLEHIQAWQLELGVDKARYNLTEWRNWLAQQLDAQTYSDPSIDCPVRLTHLAATRWRSFDAVLLLGCGANNLPGVDKGSVWFNDAVRSTLGLPSREKYLAQLRDTLVALLGMSDTVLATWQSSKGGEQALLSPYLEMLRALHELAYGDDLAEKALGDMLLGAQLRSADFPAPGPSVMPAPSVQQGLIPRTVSASGYNSLVACPYQYFARYMLRLNEMDEVKKGVEKREYGQLVHDILRRFHQQFPVTMGRSRLDLVIAIQILSDEVFAPMIKRDYLARAWLTRWLESVPSYLDAQLKNEEEGWLYQNGEVPFKMPLTADLTIRGCIDRIDHNASGSVRVLDYKLTEAGRLRNKLKKAGEDVQLPCYATVTNAETAAFVSIDTDKVVNVVPHQNLPQLAQDNIERLLQVFEQMHNGAAMPAHGVDDACTYCEMRGLCRKAEWRNSALGIGAPR